MGVDRVAPAPGRAAMAEDVDGRYCPECGKPFAASVAAGSSQARSPAWPVLLTALGIVLVVVCAWRANAARLALADAAGRLVESPGCAVDDRAEARCNAIFSRRTSLFAARASSEVSRRAAQREAVEAAVGGAALLAGVGGLLRRRRSRTLTGGSAWEAVEQWLLSAFRVLLLALALTVFTRIAQGDPPSWGLLDGAINRVGEVMVGAMASLVG